MTLLNQPLCLEFQSWLSYAGTTSSNSILSITFSSHISANSKYFVSSILREGAFLLVIDHFNQESRLILSELRSYPKSLFLYLKTVIEVHLSGTLNLSSLSENSADVSSGRREMDQSNRITAYLEKMSDLPKLLRNVPVDVTDEMIELYLEVSTFSTQQLSVDLSINLASLS